MFTDWITTQVGDDPELLAKVLPDYPATGKRTLQDNGSWLSTLKRDNVELIRTPIERITPTGVVTTDGTAHDVDIIVYATGFRATEVLFPISVTGRDGADLHEVWGSRPYAYRSIAVPGFPNFFMTYGPGAHLAHGGSLILNSELQMRYINQCLQRLITERLRTLEPLPEPTAAVAPSFPGGDPQDRVGAPVDQALLLQERRRGDPHRQSVAAEHLPRRRA